MIDIIMSPIRVFKKIVARVNMSYQNDTQETTDKNDIAQVTEIGKENGYITSEDILKIAINLKIQSMSLIQF